MSRGPAAATRLVGRVLGVLVLTAALFLGGLSRPLGGAVGGIAVLLRHRRGVLAGVAVALGLAELGSRSGAPASLTAGVGLLGGAAVGASVPATRAISPDLPDHPDPTDR